MTSPHRRPSARAMVLTGGCLAVLGMIAVVVAASDPVFEPVQPDTFAAPGALWRPAADVLECGARGALRRASSSWLHER